jgi:hypothetical protein
VTRRWIRPLLSLVVVGLFLISAAGGVARNAGSLGPQCLPCQCTHCGGGCNPPLPALQFSAVVVTRNPTNVSLSWNTNNKAIISMYFGNTSYYGYTGLALQNESTMHGSVFIDNLQPSTTYFYQLTGWDYNSTCTGGIGWLNGTWTTGSEMTYLNTTGYYVQGTVYDSSNHTAPAGIRVQVSCAYDPRDWDSWGVTDGSGFYSIYVFDKWTAQPPYTFCNQFPLGTQFMIVSVQNGFNGGGLWGGRWNLSVAIWEPQVVNFYLPANFISPYIFQITDFSNANSSNGMAGYSDISYTTGTSYTTSETYCWTLFWWWGQCSTQAAATTNVSTGWGSTNGNLLVSQRYVVTGTAAFSPINRTWTLTQETFCAPYGQPQWPAQQPISDWLVPHTSAKGVYLMKNFGGSGSQYMGRPVPPGGYIMGSATTSTTNVTTGVKGWTLDLSVGYDGVGVGSVVASQQWSQTSSETNYFTLNWKLSVPNGNLEPTCFEVFGQGGSASSNTADIIGVWAYAPSGSPNNYSCPEP